MVQFIESQFDDLYCKLKKENFLADITDKEEMSERLAYYLGEINMIHPFREVMEGLREYTLSSYA